MREYCEFIRQIAFLKFDISAMRLTVNAAVTAKCKKKKYKIKLYYLPGDK